ncbi:MAG TPA: preprotein translocase subunit SecG [Candidatus Moranbacteria bacterium]|nr:preprotein translocase subunit SecG [Candidatus Moranbacteria bacterium]
MLKIITIAEIITAILLTASILLQNRGAGLSGAFGGNFGGYYTKRGMEKFLFFLSTFLSSLFIILAIASVAVS